ncbi:hypothetical protein PG984_000755 [Apiospora sp. TS-2023a]
MDQETLLNSQNPLSLLLGPLPNEHREHGLEVVQWGPKKIQQAAEPETLAWVVDHEKNHTGRVWAKEPVRQELKDKYGVDTQQEDLDTFRGTFVNGRPLKQASITIHPCLGHFRPKRLYRAVHADQPFYGVCARNYPQIFNPVLFQIQFQKHMVWRWRGNSPFMSATCSFQKAVQKCEAYEKRKRPGIKLLIINTSGPGWDSRRLIWGAGELEMAFKVSVDHNCLGEYLITHSIPLYRVKALDWVDLKDDRVQYGNMTEPEEGWQQHERNKEAARQVTRTDDQEDASDDDDDNDDTKQATKESKRKRDGDDEGEVSRQRGKRARGFAPLKERDMEGDAS